MNNLNKRALLLSYFTVGYNIIEGLISIGTGLTTGSVALVSFGADSFIESLSGSVMIWRFRKHETLTKEDEENIERKAIRFVAYTFFILSAYVLFEAGKSLYFREAPEPTLVGIIITIASIIIMPALAYFKNQTGKKLNSKSLIADSKQTVVCVVMSITVLVGLLLNYLFGLWWAYPIAGFIIGLYLLKEGYTTLQEEKLCEC